MKIMSCRKSLLLIGVLGFFSLQGMHNAIMSDTILGALQSISYTGLLIALPQQFGVATASNCITPFLINSAIPLSALIRIITGGIIPQTQNQAVGFMGGCITLALALCYHCC